METPYLVFCCYARKDQRYLQDLKTSLKSLEREGLIAVKADIDITPGKELDEYRRSCHLPEPESSAAAGPRTYLRHTSRTAGRGYNPCIAKPSLPGQALLVFKLSIYG